MRADRLSLLLTYAIAGLGVAAALLHVSPPFAIVLVASAGLGAYWDVRDRHPLSSWVLTTITVTALLVTVAIPSPNGPVGRMLAAAIVLLGAKLLAPKAARDQMQVMLLSLLLLIGSAILTVSLSFAFLFLVYLLLCTIALMWIPFGTDLASRTVSRRFVRTVALVGVGLVVGSLPLVLLFFVGLPRSTIPLVRGVTPASAQSAGFADSLSLGDVGRIAQSNAVAFRVELPEHEGPLPEVSYWRGLVLDETDGIAWWTGKPLNPVAWQGAGPVELVGQRVYLEPQGSRALFGLDRIVSVDGPGVSRATVSGGTATMPRPVTGRIRYDVESDTSPVSLESLDPLARSHYLALPPGLPAVVAERAASVAGDARDPATKAERLLADFHGDTYTYSLDPPQREGHPLEVFLAVSKTGYCEHFASAMALMLRSLDVPARVVAGYAGGDYNPTGDYYLVRQRSAHAWVEAYIDGRGWVRYDPTPPSESAAAPGVAGSASRVALLLDAARHGWDTLVMDYDLQRQATLFRSLSSGIGRGLRWRPGPIDVGVAIALGAALITAVVAWRRRRPVDPAAGLYQSLQKRLRRRHGLIRGPSEGPCDFAERAVAVLPDRADAIRQVVDGYVRVRYGGRRMPPREAERLRGLVRRV